MPFAMLLLLLLPQIALDAPRAEPTAAQAEAAFARAALTMGQWAAFRAFAEPGATMFMPQPMAIEEALKDAPEPRLAVRWWAADSFVACDGSMAVNTGPWIRPARGATGYFTTVWVRQVDGGWKWRMDGGDALAKPRPAGDAPRIRTAACSGKPPRPPAAAPAGGKSGEGRSADGTLAWRWRVAEDGARNFEAWLWDGRSMVPIVQDRVAAPAG